MTTEMNKSLFIGQKTDLPQQDHEICQNFYLVLRLINLTTDENTTPPPDDGCTVQL